MGKDLYKEKKGGSLPVKQSRDVKPHESVTVTCAFI
jgi:hypothetical protein